MNDIVVFPHNEIRLEYDNIYEYILNEIIEKCKKIECGGNCESKRYGVSIDI